MPSVRDKYRSAVQNLERAESVPERFGVFRQVWAWLVEASKTSAAFAGMLIIPAILITVGSIRYNDCGENPEIPPFLIAIGVCLLLCALYFPIYRRAKQKARKAREEGRIGDAPIPNTPLTREEVERHVPLKMNKVSNFAFMVGLAILPIMAFKLFFRLDKTAHCAPIVYWTAFVLSMVYIIWAVTMIAACVLVGCTFFIVPTLVSWTRRGRNNQQRGQENV